MAAMQLPMSNIDVDRMRIRRRPRAILGDLPVVELQHVTAIERSPDHDIHQAVELKLITWRTTQKKLKVYRVYTQRFVKHTLY